MTTRTTLAGLAAVRAEIARACKDAGRDPAGVTLVAVAKTFGADAIEPVIAQGFPQEYRDQLFIMIK